MNALRMLQQGFQAAVLAAGEAAPGGRWIAPPGAGAAVYRHAYRARLGEVLALEYPKLAAWLGPETFGRVAEGYIDVHPSRRPSVRDFGAAFPAFLARQQNLPEPARSAALARFEWALGTVFDAPDAEPLTPETLAILPPEAWPGLRLDLVPAVRICRIEPATVALWQRLDGGAIADGPPASARIRSHVVWRSSGAVRFRALARDESIAMVLLRRGRTIAGFCTDLARRLPGAPPAPTAARLLRRFAALGMLTTAAPRSRSLATSMTRPPTA